MVSENEDFIFDLTCLKKNNICGVSRCRSRSLDANPNGKLPHFLLHVFLQFVGCVGTQTLKSIMFNDEKSKM
jgi:hypothetical protein